MVNENKNWCRRYLKPVLHLSFCMERSESALAERIS